MIITTTGIAFLFSSAGLAFCGIRFFEAFKSVGGQNSRRNAGILVSAYYFFTSVQHLILALGATIFANSPSSFLAIISANNLLLSFIAAWGVYTVFYIVYPKSSPWPSILITLLVGLLLFFLNIIEYSPPNVTVSNSLDWNISRSTAMALIYISVVAIGSPIVIFIKNILYLEGKVRNIFSILCFLQLLGVINVMYLFGGSLYSIGESTNYFFDRLLLFIGIVFIFFFFVMPIIHRTSQENNKITQGKDVK